MSHCRPHGLDAFLALFKNHVGGILVHIDTYAYMFASRISSQVKL